MRSEIVLFVFAAALTLTGAVAALALRNLIHCALAAVAAFLGLALLYLNLGAQFVGLAQILIYVGAVAILILMATLFTRGGQTSGPITLARARNAGLAVAVLVGGSLIVAILGSRRLPGPVTGAVEPASVATVRQIGDRLMTDYVLPLEVVGLLLTAALIGAVLVAKDETRGGEQPTADRT